MNLDLCRDHFLKLCITQKRETEGYRKVSSKRKKNHAHKVDSNKVLLKVKLNTSLLVFVNDGRSFRVRKVKAMQKCLKPTVFLITSMRWFLHVQLYSSLWEKCFLAPLIYGEDKHSPEVLVATFKFSF